MRPLPGLHCAARAYSASRSDAALLPGSALGEPYTHGLVTVTAASLTVRSGQSNWGQIATMLALLIPVGANPRYTNNQHTLD